MRIFALAFRLSLTEPRTDLNREVFTNQKEVEEHANIAHQLWADCLKMIEANVSQQQFATWFEPIQFVSFITEENELTLSVPSAFFHEYLEEHYVNLIRSALYRYFGRGVRLSYIVTTDATNGLVQRITPGEVIKNSPTKIEGVNQGPHFLQQLDPQLKANYTFQNFVVGNANKLPASVGRAIAQHPEQSTFNPLFIYGGSGVGKTHLVTAIGHMVRSLHPEKRVLYVSAHLFQVQYTNSIRQNTFNDFINFYQTIDVLIIDDIQELVGQTKTQLAFFHIFNHLHQNGRQLILTSDRPPVALHGMEERLLTRFKWGLLAELEMPDEQMRRDILLQKIRQDGLRIESKVVDFIAQNVTHSVRDLEGVLTSLMAYSIVNDSDVDLPLAERVISRTIGLSRQREALTIDDILEHTCSFFSIDRKDMLSSSRKAPVVLARQVAMYLAERHTNLSTTKIGVFVGRRGHATVIHSCRTITDRIRTDERFRQQISELEELLLR